MQMLANRNFPANPEDTALVKEAIEESNRIRISSSSQENIYGSFMAQGGFKNHWWGVELWLDGDATSKLNKMLTAGAGVAALVAAISSWTGVGGAAAAVVAGAFAAASGVSGLCNWNDRGISIRKPHVGPVICWPR